jgi:hypothetical protein
MLRVENAVQERTKIVGDHVGPDESGTIDGDCCHDDRNTCLYV